MEKKAWAQLKSIKSNGFGLAIKIYENKFTFGRSKKCDLSYPDNKMLSSEHGFIEKDKNGRVWLVDTSRNGVLINLKNKVNDDKEELNNNDKIFLVYRVNEPEKNVAFQFELLKDEDEILVDNKKEQKKMDNNIEEPKEKNLKTKIDDKNEEKEEPESKKLKTDVEKIEKKEDKVETKKETETACASTASASNDDDIADTLTCSICQEIMHDCVSLQPCMHTYCAGCYSEWMEKSDICPMCRLKVDRICKNHIVNNLIEAYLKIHPNKKRSDASIAEVESKNKITHDMLYPKEKQKLKAKKRFEEDEEYEYEDEEEGYADENYDDEEEEEEEEPYVPPPPQPLRLFAQPVVNNYPFNNAFNNPFNNGFNNPYNPFQPLGGFGAINNPNRYVCRQCPANKLVYKIDAKYPDYTCTLVQNHLLCQCCLEPMPDRSTEIANNPQFPRQVCSVCFKAYCHLYWGCKKDGCKGCLAKFQDHVFDATYLNNLINENQHESKILSDYLKKSNKTIQNMFNECIRKMRNGVFRSTVINQQFPHEKFVCHNCALKAFQDYSYVYRSEIPKDDLPDDVKNRADCKWGKNCRTQKHNILHAQRYNHICDQT